MNTLHELLTQYKKGEVPAEDYHIMNAGWVSQHTHEYKPQYYETLNGRISAYCDGRMNGSTDYNPIAAIELGRWFDKTTRIFYENAANKELLEWCLEKLTNVKMAGAVSKLEMTIGLFDRIKFDNNKYLNAIETKKIDGSHRRGKS